MVAAGAAASAGEEQQSADGMEPDYKSLAQSGEGFVMNGARVEVGGGHAVVATGNAMAAAAALSVTGKEEAMEEEEDEEEDVEGWPEWRLALKRPRRELTPRERALKKVARYCDKFGDLFLRQAAAAAQRRGGGGNSGGFRGKDKVR